MASAYLFGQGMMPAWTPAQEHLAAQPLHGQNYARSTPRTAKTMPCVQILETGRLLNINLTESHAMSRRIEHSTCGESAIQTQNTLRTRTALWWECDSSRSETSIRAADLTMNVVWSRAVVAEWDCGKNAVQNMHCRSGSGAPAGHASRGHGTTWLCTELERQLLLYKFICQSARRRSPKPENHQTADLYRCRCSCHFWMASGCHCPDPCETRVAG